MRVRRDVCCDVDSYSHGIRIPLVSDSLPTTYDLIIIIIIITFPKVLAILVPASVNHVTAL